MARITEIYAFIAQNSGPEDEGVAGFASGMGWMPMVAANRSLVERLRPVAQEISRASGKKIQLVRFTTREDIEEVG